MAITRGEILHIAKLARLNLNENEIDKFTGQFQDILGYIDMLNELDTDDVLPTSQVTGLLNVMREDKETRFSDKESLLNCSNLPKERGQIKVKSVF